MTVFQVDDRVDLRDFGPGTVVRVLNGEPLAYSIRTDRGVNVVAGYKAVTASTTDERITTVTDTDLPRAEYTKADLDEAYERGYDAGNDRGYEQGYDDGREEGSDSDYESGYDAARSEYEGSGYDEGYDEGYAAGLAEAAAEGEGA